MKTKKRVSEPRGGQSHRPQVTPPRAVTRRDPPTAELQNLYLRHPSSERNRSGWCLSVSQYKAVIIHMTRITRTKRIRKNGCCRGPARAVPRRRRADCPGCAVASAVRWPAAGRCTAPRPAGSFHA